MKKYKIGIIMAVFAFIAMLPQQAFAAGKSENEAIQLERKGESMAASVSLTLPNAAGEKISSLQLSLKASPTVPIEFKFDEKITQTAKIYEAPEHRQEGTVNIYIVGTEPLYAESESTLTLGELTVEADQSASVKVEASGVKLVRGSAVEDLDLTNSIEFKAKSTATPTAEPSKPAAVTPKSTQVSAVSNVASGITVKWKKSSNASGYYIYRKTAKTSWKKIATVKGNAKLSYTDKAVKAKNGTKYYYTVKAYNGNKVSDFNKSGTQIVRLTAPTLSKPVSKSSRKMLVKWKKNAKAGGYQIQYSRSSEFAKNNESERITSGKTTSKTVTKLKKKATYYVRIRSYKKVNGKTYYSGWSAAKKVKIK